MGESHEGRSASCKEPLVRQTFLNMDDSVEGIDLFSGVAASRDSNGDAMQLPPGCLAIYTLSHWVIRSFPLCGVKVKVLHPTQKSNSAASCGDRQVKKGKENGAYPGCLADVVSGMLQGVVANPTATQHTVYKLSLIHI